MRVFDIWVRIQERIRALKKAMQIRRNSVVTSQNILGYRHYADDVVEKFVERAAKWSRCFQVFDAMNDTEILGSSRVCQKCGKLLRAPCLILLVLFIL